jgi:cytochrome c|tara:strand:- start:10212 stop:12305 length:2094 start_codon:yes stop_codon:yes gene_type:complete
MKNVTLSLILTFIASAGAGAESPPPNTAFNVLVFSKTVQFRHASIVQGQQAMIAMGADKGFAVTTTEDGDDFNDRNLQDYRVVLFLNTTGDVLDEGQQSAMQRFIQAGGGFVGIHAAADTEYDWSWYGGLVGGYFDGHPNFPNVRDATLSVIDQQHLATRDLDTTWLRADEWYDFKSMQPDVIPLLLIDENTYKRSLESPASEPRPIAWYHAYDGGRAFYTGLGHTKASYEEGAFLNHLYGGILYAAGERFDTRNTAEAPAESRFTKIVLDSNLGEPMELDILPDNRVIFIERRGSVKIYDPSARKSTVAATLDVYSEQEDGVIGLAVDPDHSDNHWVYIMYSPAGEEAKQHVSRFVLQGSRLDMKSEKVVLVVPTQRDQCCHSGGSLEFGPDGTLYISTGDDTNPFASSGFAPMDEQSGRHAWDAQRTSGNSNDLRGKILRIKPEVDGTYSTPDGNLFPREGSRGLPEIYVMGCRNPFRISIDQRTGFLYWGDVGPDAAQDLTGRGPRGHDEINQARAAGFFGWPYFNANNKPYYDYSFSTKTASDRPFDPAHPVNDSPNNSGARDLPPAQPAIIWYPYVQSAEFPMMGEGGRTSMAGPIYYYDDFPANDHKLPRYYDGKLFTYDWIRGFIMAVTMHEDGSIAHIERFLPNMDLANPMDMVINPNDGLLYMIEYGKRWNTQNPDARLFRIEYQPGK